ncbi:MAG: hypothetical protein Q9191_005815 [Dirinaria sp. TL-2023a]
MLPNPLLIISGAIPFLTLPIGAFASNSSILNFDDIPTSQGLGSIPSTYHHLAFSQYNVLTPRDPNLKDRISSHDLNCAVSSPNALIGSRVSSSNKHYSYDRESAMREGGAYFSVANASDMLLHAGLQPHFSLVSFNLKPLDAPSPGSSIVVNGYSHARNESDPFRWHVDFPAGFHRPFLVKMQEYSGEAWDRLYGVEILADFGEQRLDWEFCIDDLEVRFFALDDSTSELVGDQPHLQVVLGDD